ncbi:MAG: hypothetical protein RBT16_12525 [Desulfococcus multivorans]|jgi:hypothetical protein|uniref:hypothetical protein n=1 Tax=Desulfococcus sp. TaxID=2025834 RepID=UPI002A49EC06|nr:hypothetical protein [Desulfococcus multivorans]
MKPKQKILEFIQSAYEDNDKDKSSSTSEAIDPNDREIVRELFDGMSTGTARIIIEKKIDLRIAEEYKIEGLENKGRYYAARIVGPDGNTIQRLLVDKQTGKVQFTGR